MQVSPVIAALVPPDLDPVELPRELAWTRYQALAVGCVEASRALNAELAAILRGERGDDFEGFLRSVEVLGHVHRHLATAAAGLEAVRTSQGVA